MKFLQEVRGYTLVTSRRPAPRLGSIDLSQMRSQLGESRPFLKRRLSVTVNPQDVSNTAVPVRIIRNVAAMPARARAR